MALITNPPLEAQPPRRALGRRAIAEQQVALTLITVVTAVLVIGPLLVLVRTSLLPSRTLPWDTLAVTWANFATAYLGRRRCGFSGTRSYTRWAACWARWR